MERLTIKPGICANASTEYCESQEDCYLCPHGKQMRFRLSDYEDTGLAPEEITAPVGWINIKDKPPEISGEYLVYDENGNIYNCEFDVAIGDNGEFGYWEAHYHPDTLGFLDSDWVQNESVTHWMPLPEPPKEERE